MVYSTRRFVVCLTMCHFVLVFFTPFSIAITSLGEERANLSAFRTFVRFVLVWICRFPLPLGVWEGLRFVIVALPGLFSFLFFPICFRAPQASRICSRASCRGIGKIPFFAGLANCLYISSVESTVSGIPVWEQRRYPFSQAVGC